MGTGHNITCLMSQVFTGYRIPFRMTGTTAGKKRAASQKQE